LIIFSIIVTYRPDIFLLQKTVEKIISSGSRMIIVDNSNMSTLLGMFDEKHCQIIQMGSNTGIAKAQNVGIKVAIEQNADVILFFDQDSEIGDTFISDLLGPINLGEPEVLAPVYFDKIKGYEFPSMKLNIFGMLAKVYRVNKTSTYPVDVVISSGMAVTKEAFEIVGLMDEDFFIDYVDTEWCLRCRSKDVQIRISPAASMVHSIGESSKDLGFLKIFIHSPIRSYYQIRNSFYFLKKEHVPIILGLKEVLSLFLHHIIVLIFLDNRKDYLVQYLQAFKDGIRGVKGKKPELN
jgi:rhamnosyltransferase